MCSFPHSHILWQKHHVRANIDARRPRFFGIFDLQLLLFSLLVVASVVVAFGTKTQDYSRHHLNNKVQNIDGNYDDELNCHHVYEFHISGHHERHHNVHA